MFLRFIIAWFTASLIERMLCTYNSTDDKINNFQVLLNQIEQYHPMRDKHLIHNAITKVGDIYRNSWFDEQYAFEIPKILNKWYLTMKEKDERFGGIYMPIVDAVLVKELNLYTLDKVNKAIDLNKFGELDDATKALLRSSKEIAMHLVRDTPEATENIPMNCMKLIHAHCWENLYGNYNPFNDFGNDLYTQQTDHLLMLISEFDFILIHPQYLTQKWINVTVSDYVHAHWQISQQNLLGDDQDLGSQFSAKYIVKVLQYAEDSQEETELQILINDVINYFIIEQMQRDKFEVFLFGLKHLNYLKTIKQFSLSELNKMYSRQEIKQANYFVSELCYVTGDGNVRNDINRTRCENIAESLYLWKIEEHLESMMKIKNLCDNSFGFFQQIIAVSEYILFVDRCDYLMEASKQLKFSNWFGQNAVLYLQ